MFFFNNIFFWGGGEVLGMGLLFEGLMLALGTKCIPRKTKVFSIFPELKIGCCFWDGSRIFCGI